MSAIRRAIDNSPTDWLKVMLVGVGVFLFTAGFIIALRDAFLDYNVGPWGVLGGAMAGLGAVLGYYGKLI